MKRFVKKIVVLTLVLAMLAPIISKNDSQAAIKGYYFKNAGVSVTMSSKAKKFIKKAGKPTSTKTSKSCAFKGLDRIRKYKNFILYTYSNSEKGAEYVNGITFLTSSAKTKEGIHIGSTEAEMKKAYGNGSSALGIYTYTKGKTKLMIQVKDGKVTNVRYVMK